MPKRIYLNTFFTPFSSVSIVDFEQVNVCRLVVAGARFYL